MDNLVNNMYKHPFVTWLFIGAIGSGIVSIISAAKGQPMKPAVVINKNEKV